MKMPIRAVRANVIMFLCFQVIKPFKEKPKLPENYEDDSWHKLQV